jgi:HAD superfamily hydrolase (TIGR01509 family)
MFDFDGPICSVFAGLPAPEVADQLRRVLVRLDASLTAELEQEDDPLSIYRHSVNEGPAVVAAIYYALVDAELKAVRSATPTAGAADALAAAHESGRSVAVVSNNAAAAVTVYLRQHLLMDRVDYVAARRTPEPGLMKPNPHYLIDAATALGVSPHECALVGDSATDAEAAKRAGMFAVGYANKPGKAERLADAGADVIIRSMSTLALALRSHTFQA